MKRVMISKLKAHLSAYLAEVRKGETILVCDRDKPVAVLKPVEKSPYRFRGEYKPEEIMRIINEIPPLDVEIDVVALLRESRDQR
jgi:prevent-host-death family protein